MTRRPRPRAATRTPGMRLARAPGRAHSQLRWASSWRPRPRLPHRPRRNPSAAPPSPSTTSPRSSQTRSSTTHPSSASTLSSTPATSRACGTTTSAASSTTGQSKTRATRWTDTPTWRPTSRTCGHATAGSSRSTSGAPGRAARYRRGRAGSAPSGWSPPWRRRATGATRRARCHGGRTPQKTASFSTTTRQQSKAKSRRGNRRRWVSNRPRRAPSRPASPSYWARFATTTSQSLTTWNEARAGMRRH